MTRIHSLNLDNWSSGLSGNSSDCNSNPRCRCKDPNSANTDCCRVMAVVVREAAKDFDLAEVAAAEQMWTAAADGMACMKP